MKIWIWQHVPFEGPGAIADWAADRDLTLQMGLAGRDLPALKLGDRLTGGPLKEARYPWLRDAKVFLQKALCELGMGRSCPPCWTGGGNECP